MRPRHSCSHRCGERSPPVVLEFVNQIAAYPARHPAHRPRAANERGKELAPDARPATSAMALRLWHPVDSRQAKAADESAIVFRKSGITADAASREAEIENCPRGCDSGLAQSDRPAGRVS